MKIQLHTCSFRLWLFVWLRLTHPTTGIEPGGRRRCAITSMSYHCPLLGTGPNVFVSGYSTTVMHGTGKKFSHHSTITGKIYFVSGYRTTRWTWDCSGASVFFCRCGGLCSCGRLLHSHNNLYRLPRSKSEGQWNINISRSRNQFICV